MMRITISGTHAMGKRTPAEDFVENHPEFVLFKKRNALPTDVTPTRQVE
jgi:hypothetical protein